MIQTSDLWPGDVYRMRETLPAEDHSLFAGLARFSSEFRQHFDTPGVLLGRRFPPAPISARTGFIH